jgi:hypothetical protein
LRSSRARIMRSCRYLMSCPSHVRLSVVSLPAGCAVMRKRSVPGRPPFRRSGSPRPGGAVRHELGTAHGDEPAHRARAPDRAGGRLGELRTPVAKHPDDRGCRAEDVRDDLVAVDRQRRDDRAVQLGHERVADQAGRLLELDETGDRGLVAAVRRPQDQAFPSSQNFVERMILLMLSSPSQGRRAKLGLVIWRVRRSAQARGGTAASSPA